MDDSSLAALPVLELAAWSWDDALGGANRSALSAVLAAAIPARRWFGSKTRSIASLELVDAFVLSPTARLLLARVHFSQGADEIYQVPLAFCESDAGDARPGDAAILMRVVARDGRLLGALYDPLGEPEFCRRLLALFESADAVAGSGGELVARRTSSFDRVRGERVSILDPRLLAAEQSNSSVAFGQRLILKIFRRVEMGVNPDLEISEHLTRHGFERTPPLAGSLEYRPSGQEPWTLAMLQAFVPNQGDAWRFTLDWLAAALAKANATPVVPPLPSDGICRAAQRSIPPAPREAFGEFLLSARRLGKRTAEMHLALAAETAAAAFAPEAFRADDRRAYFERCAAETRATFQILAAERPHLGGRLAEQAQHLLSLEGTALSRYAHLADEASDVAKIRTHGDYHLGQVLATGGEFTIIDFEGEPARSLDQRREKQLALRDVAGMIRSFHYASCAAAAAHGEGAARSSVAEWTRSWYAWTSVAFLSGYLATAGEAAFLPRNADAFERLLTGCLLEKAVYELLYELNNRPDWVYLPLTALGELLE